jgi:alkylation response protein AidB-like acyl-CoA dehydrogenase
MNYGLPDETTELITAIDEFVEEELKPLEEDNPEFFNHRREASRTNWDDGTPTKEWKHLLETARDRADEAGFYHMNLPEELGGENIGYLTETVLKEHLATKGPGIHCIAHTGLAWETPIGEWRNTLAIYRHGTEEQKSAHLDDLLNREKSLAFGMTEPDHGSDPTYMDTTAEKDGDEWVINGRKRFIGGMDDADLIQLFARTSGEKGSPKGITSFLVQTDAPGIEIPYFHWTMNMPSTQAEIEIDDLRVSEDAILGERGNGLQQQGMEFLIEGWLGQSTVALGTAQFCINEIVEYANERETFGKSLSRRQGVQFPVVELNAEAEMVRNLLYKVAWKLDQGHDRDDITELISMANYRATNLANQAADQAIQIFGGKGWTRHYPFEYLYRQFRRYRITEGADEIQKRRAAGYLFNFI